MAVAPLFVADMTTLKVKLKLDGAKAAGTSAAIDQAVLEVREGFYRRLTGARIATLVALTYTDAPATDNDYLRLVANNCEVAWVKFRLIRVLPTLFFDGSGSALQAWNQEGFTRDQNTSDREKELVRLANEIEQKIDLLALRETAGSDSTINVSVIEPDIVPDLPGASVFPLLRNPANRGWLDDMDAL